MEPEICTTASRMPANGWSIHFASTAAEPEITAGPLAGLARNDASGRMVLLADSAFLRPGSAARRAAKILTQWDSGTPAAQLWELLTGSGTMLLWEPAKRLLRLGVDRLGGGGLIRYHGGALTAANTLTAPHLGAGAALSKQAIHDYLSLQYVPERTVFPDLFKLKGGSSICLSLNNFQEYREQWCQTCIKVGRPLPEEKAVSRLRELITAAVRQLLEEEGGKETAILLSGGIDSAITAGVALQLGQREFKAYTACFQESAYDERARAEASASRLMQVTGQRITHRLLTVTPDDWPLFARLLRQYGQPYGDASLLATARIARQAADEGAELLLSGDAADEFFGGYERYRFMQLSRSVPPLPGAGFAARLLPDGGERTLNGRFRRLFPALEHGGLARYLQLLDRFPAADKREVYGRRMLERSKYLRPPLRLASLKGGTGSGIAPYQQWDVEHYMPGDVLVKSALAAVNAEVPIRSPFLDQEVINFALQLPEELKIRGRCRKYLLARAFPEFVPSELANRRKTGFGVPVSAWLRGPWKNLLQETLLEGRFVREEYFRRSVVEKWIAEHVSGRRDRGYELWSLLTLEVSLS